MPISYPNSLPNPAVSLTLTTAERRMAFGPPLNIGAFETGYRGVLKLQFQYKASHAATFRAWWRYDLVRGLKWFTASWPNAYGFTPKVYRFKPNTMVLGYIGFEYFSVETECYARGLSLPPV